MLIRVIYTNGAYDMVRPDVLDDMLARGAVAGFLRGSGWVVVGRDPIRSRSRQPYSGPERRKYSPVTTQQAPFPHSSH